MRGIWGAGLLFLCLFSQLTFAKVSCSSLFRADVASVLKKVEAIPITTGADFYTHHSLEKFDQFYEILRGLSSEDLQKVQAALEKKIGYTYDFADHESTMARRDLEYYYRLSHEGNFQNFWTALQQSQSGINEKALVQIVNQYFQKIAFKKIQGRGFYSFEKVLDIAHYLQQELSPLLDDSLNHVVMYGSFPNGKADLRISDIDLHLSRSLTDQYILEYEVNFPGLLRVAEHDRGLKIPGQGWVSTPFKSVLNKAENSAAQYLNRRIFRYGALISIIPERFEGEFYDRQGVSLYNPIQLIIYKNKLQIDIFDSVAKSRIVIDIIR